MLVKNQIYEAEITDYTAEGQGVAHIEGCAVFIPNAVAGEKVRVRVEKAQKTWAAGKIVEILEKSPHRVNRECEVAKLCGGCDFWHMDYAEETRLKAERVKTCLNRIGGENLAEVPILAAPDCHGYRNKAQYPVAVKKGRAYAGFYRAGTHDVVENARCRILPEEIDAAKDAVIDYVNQYRVSVYDETTGKGLLRHIYVRRGAVSGQVLVCLAVNGEKIPRPEALVQRLNGIPGFTTLVLSVNTKRGNAVLGDRFLTLHGPGYIEDTLCGLNFRLSPRSFYQVNHHQAQRLYEMAISQAEIPAEAKYITINCVSNNIFVFMVDDIFIGVELPEGVDLNNMKENISFEVYLDGEKINTTQQSNYLFSGLNKGKYKAGVKAVFSSVTTPMTEIEFDVEEGSGIEENQLNGRTIHPNPAKETVTVSGEYDYLSIFDISGKEKARYFYGETINVRNLPSGIYIVRIVSGSQTEVTKLVVTK